MSPHLYLALGTCFVARGGAAASGGLGKNCTGLWGLARGGGGMIFSLNSFHAWSVALSRSMLERAPSVPLFVDVWSRSQCKSGVALRSSPNNAAVAVINFHAFIRIRKGDPNNGFTKARGAIMVLHTSTVLDATVSYWNFGLPGTVAAKAASRSVTFRYGTSRTVSHYGLTSMVVGSFPGGCLGLRPVPCRLLGCSFQRRG